MRDSEELSDRSTIQNRHGKSGWCRHLSRKTASSFEFTSDDDREVYTLGKKDCVCCPYCKSRRPANI